jgi:hypothetical protein
MHGGEDMRKYIRNHWSAYASAGTNTFDIEVGPRDRVRILNWVTLINMTSAMGKTKLGIWDGVNFYVFSYLSSCITRQQFSSSSFFAIFPGEVIRFYCEGCTAGDFIDGIIDGHFDDDIEPFIDPHPTFSSFGLYGASSSSKFFRIKKRYVGASGTNSLILEAGPINKIRYIYLQYFWNDTTDIQNIFMGRSKVGEFIMFIRAGVLTKGTPAKFGQYMILLPGESVEWRYDDGAAGDDVFMWVDGFYNEDKNEGGP